MCDIIRYRGPDDAGYVLFPSDNSSHRPLELTDNEFLNKNFNIPSLEDTKSIAGNNYNCALGHRRLAIIDLSSKAHQPMSDSNKKVWITYNGEIYNFRELRTQLMDLGYRFISQSDTEVIINSYKEWGIDCVKKFNGMFAFALLDVSRNKLFLARDRYGIKPLYYYSKNNIVIFASEIKSILASDLLKTDVNLEALHNYFTFQNIFTDITLFKDINLLPPGSYLELNLNSNSSSRFVINKYWDYLFSDADFNLSEKQTIDKLHSLFIQAVNRQLVSDVPVGSYLSGGMDTGSIVSIASRHFGRISTFTCGFDLSSASGMELSFDERQSAEYMANLFKTEHYEVVLHAGDMEQVMPELIYHLEDLRMGQCYPNYYISRLAGKFLKVVLSGAGGDELFGGYPWRYYRGINPKNMDDYLSKYYYYWQRLVPDEDKKQFFNHDVIRQTKGYSTFDVFKSVYKQHKIVPKSNNDFINHSMYFEIKTFLHGLFIVEDKLSMAHSLETRLPFMDNDLVDFAIQIPVTYKLKNIDHIIQINENEPDKLRKYYQTTSDGKKILRAAMKHIIPDEILEREKFGFSAPDASWFRGESIDYVNQLLTNHKSRIYDYLNPEYINQRFEEHLSGKINHRLFIWSLICFEWWLKTFLDKKSS